MGLLRLGERPPDRIPSVEQRAFAEVPAQCPKCGSVFLVVTDRRIACPGTLAGCGWDAFLVTEHLEPALS